MLIVASRTSLSRARPNEIAPLARTLKSSRRALRTVAMAGEAQESLPAAPKPPPYATLSMPVYSLCTKGTQVCGPAHRGVCTPSFDWGSWTQTFNGVSTSRASMNILTYATPVAITPARRFVIALYHGTLSADNMLSKGTGVLQILGEQHAELLELLGKSSAHEMDKMAELEARGFEVVERYGCPTLKDCVGVVHLRIESLQDIGDHDLALCDVLAYDTFEGNGDPLYTGTLRSMGLLT